jgi:hypothetical protein
MQCTNIRVFDSYLEKDDVIYSSIGVQLDDTVIKDVDEEKSDSNVSPRKGWGMCSSKSRNSLLGRKS